MGDISVVQVLYTVALGILISGIVGGSIKARKRGKEKSTIERIKRARMEELAKSRKKCA